jgi:rare lipoprotein A
MVVINRRFKGRVASIVVGLGVCVGACSTQTELWPQPTASAYVNAPLPAATPRSAPTVSQTVLTSYQGSGTAGRTTASGEPYDPHNLTAASRNLPIGSIVKVTNAQTGRSVKVRINDRGPFVHGRSLDLSKKAAEKIGITHKGVARVKVTRVNSHPVALKSEAPSPAGPPASPEAD